MEKKYIMLDSLNVQSFSDIIAALITVVVTIAPVLVYINKQMKGKANKDDVKDDMDILREDIAKKMDRDDAVQMFIDRDKEEKAHRSGTQKQLASINGKVDMVLEHLLNRSKK